MGRLNALLDTHAFLWAISDPDLLSTRAADVIGDSKNQLFLSSVSVWEIAIKVSTGKLKLRSSPKLTPDYWLRQQMDFLMVSTLTMRTDHALQTISLPMLHRDPFDRMLVAQAQVERLPLVTSDVLVKQYDVETIW